MEIEELTRQITLRGRPYRVFDINMLDNKGVADIRKGL